jgi:hypothetical protein
MYFKLNLKRIRSQRHNFTLKNPLFSPEKSTKFILWNKCIKSDTNFTRLVSDLGLTGTEAFQHLNELIDSANAALTGALSAKIIDEHGDKGEIDLLEDLYQRHLFDPLRDNVIFGAAYDGWGFSLDDFTEIVAKNFGFKKSAVKKFLWGEYYFDKKKKKITTKPKNEK